MNIKPSNGSGAFRINKTCGQLKFYGALVINMLTMLQDNDLWRLSEVDDWWWDKCLYSWSFCHGRYLIIVCELMLLLWILFFMPNIFFRAVLDLFEWFECPGWSQHAIAQWPFCRFCWLQGHAAILQSGMALGVLVLPVVDLSGTGLFSSGSKTNCFLRDGSLLAQGIAITSKWPNDKQILWTGLPCSWS